MRERNAKTAGNPTTKDMDAKAAGLPQKRDRNGTLLPRVVIGSEDLEAQMWRETGGHVKVVIRRMDEEAEPQQLTWQDALDGLSSDSPAFRELLSETLQELPFDAFFWECPPVSLATLGTRLFEFVALDAPRLARVQADQVSFKEHLNRYRGQRVSKAFLNLGGDAMLVAPAAAVKDVQAYAHIASFFRQAPPEQLDQQWLTLGSALERRLREVGPRRNVWVSTDGTGVYWLHMRLDARPKYYHYRAYQDPDHEPHNDSNVSDAKVIHGSGGLQAQMWHESGGNVKVIITKAAEKAREIQEPRRHPELVDNEGDVAMGVEMADASEGHSPTEPRISRAALDHEEEDRRREREFEDMVGTMQEQHRQEVERLERLAIEQARRAQAIERAPQQQAPFRGICIQLGPLKIGLGV